MPRMLSINFDLINDDDLSKLNASKESILDGILLLAKILVAKSTFEKVLSRSDLIELYKLLIFHQYPGVNHPDSHEKRF